MAEERSRREQFLKTQVPFKTNAFEIIRRMDDWCNVTQGSKHLMDEMLHSIFFLGKINKVPFSPEEIIPDTELFNTLKNKYSRPFDCYLTRLPRRSPFSCVLDVIVLQKKPENENQIKKSLQDLVKSLEKGFLVSSTICISKSNTSVKHYGVSMSTTGPNPGQIVIAASCLSNWDDYVAGAVMTYYPKKEKEKKEYFDGTIKLPANVSCQAYVISDGKEMEPCKSCGNLFGLKTTVKKEWDYGHCAEAESLSNLLKNEKEVRDGVTLTAGPYQQKDRVRAKDSVLKELRNVLSRIQFKTWDGEYYKVQTQ